MDLRASLDIQGKREISLSYRDSTSVSFNPKPSSCAYYSVWGSSLLYVNTVKRPMYAPVFDIVCTVHRNKSYKTNQQDALSVCIYSSIFVQLYMFRTTISFIMSSWFTAFCSYVLLILKLILIVLYYTYFNNILHLIQFR